MNQQPDKLFRDKLEDYKRPVPPAIWHNLAAAQQKRKRKGVWLKYAAAAVLLTGSAYLLWPEHDQQPFDANRLAQTSPETAQDLSHAPTDRNTPAHQEDMVTPAPEKSREIHNNKSNTRHTEHLPAHTVTEPSLATTALTETPDSSHWVATPAAQVTPDPTLSTPAAPTIQTRTEQTITLVFTAREVNDYLNKNDAAQATPDEKKPSTLMKLLKKANGLKNNQDPLGELRQKKNEILALNFKSDKQREQNK